MIERYKDVSKTSNRSSNSERARRVVATNFQERIDLSDSTILNLPSVYLVRTVKSRIW